MVESIQLKQVRMYKKVRHFILENYPFFKNQCNNLVRVKTNMDYLVYTRHSLVNMGWRRKQNWLDL